MEDNYVNGRSSFKSPARRAPNYRRDGPLSPLRSPLNRKFGGDLKRSHNHESGDRIRGERSHRYSTSRRTERQPDNHLVSQSENGSPADANTSWADITDEYEEKQELAKKDLETFQRRRQRLSEGSQSMASSDDLSDEIETDETVLMRRQKQIDYGKCNESYEQYSAKYPRFVRKQGTHPKTPNKFKKCSRRAFDGMVRCWKLDVHKFAASGPSTPRSTGSSGSTNITPSSTCTDGEESLAGNSPAVEERASRKQLMFSLSGTPKPDILNYDQEEQW